MKNQKRISSGQGTIEQSFEKALAEKSIAQGTIEYLVILAVIVVIALVLVTLLVSQTDTVTISEEQSKLYWKAQPISIVESVADSEGDAIIKLSSSEYGNFDKLKINDIEFDANDFVLTSGGEYVLFLTGLTPACTGENGYYTVTIYYYSQYGLQQVISGTMDLVIDCEDDVSEDDIDGDYEIISGGIRISLLSPSNGSTDADGEVDFTYSVLTPGNSNEEVQSCSLLTGTSPSNLTVTGTPDTSEPYDSFSNTFSSEGTYYWDVNCEDDDADTYTSTNGPWQIIYGTTPTDSDPPVFDLLTPSNPTTDTDGTVTFTYEDPTDDSAISNCELLIDGSSVVTDSDGTYGTFTDYTFSLEGTYEWDVNCTDEHGNEGSSGNGPWTIIIDTSPSLFAGGDGTLANPYQIETCEHLQNMNTELDANYILNQDIDCDVVPYNTGSGFDPIGYCGDDDLCWSTSDNTNFTGSLKGQDYTITGLYVNSLTEIAGGLFESTGSNFSANNIKFTDANITSQGFSGTLAAFNQGEITNIELTNSNIQSVTSWYTGGLIGYHQSTENGIQNILSTDNNIMGPASGSAIVGGIVGSINSGGPLVNLSSTNNRIITNEGDSGGIVGASSGTNGVSTGLISKSNYISTGLGKAGGLMGLSNDTITRSYSEDNYISGANDQYTDGVGGLFGFGNNLYLTDSYSKNNTIISDQKVGGIVGYLAGSIENVYSSNNTISASIYEAGGIFGIYDAATTITKSYSTNNYVEVNYEFDGRGGTFGGLQNNGSISNSFSNGTLVSTDTTTIDGFVYKNAGTISNVFWHDSNSTDSIDSCLTGCTVETNVSNFYDVSTHNVYTSGGWNFGNPGTDNNWSNVCDGAGYPPLMWQGITDPLDCANATMLLSAQNDTTGNYDRGEDIFVDSSGNIYMAGRFDSDTDFGNGVTVTHSGGSNSDMLIVKYNSDGVAQWARSAGGTASDQARGVFVDSSGNVFVVGSFWSSTMDFGGGTTLTNQGSIDFFLAKYNSSGTLQWVKSSENNSGTSADIVYGVVTDPSTGDIYMAGGSDSDIDFGNGISLTNDGYSDFFVVKYNSAGTAQWVKSSEGGTGTSNDYAIDIAMDSSGNVYAGGFVASAINFGDGHTSTFNGGTDFFIVKYNSSGTTQWVATPQSGSAGGEDSVWSVSIDGSDNIIAAGRTQSNLDLGGGNTTTHDGGIEDFFVAKYDSLGAAQWVRSSENGSGTSSDSAWGSFADSSGNAYVCGTTASNLDLGNNFVLSIDGFYDFFVAKYDSSGNVKWVGTSMNDSGTANDSCQAIYVDSSGSIYSTGYTESDIDLGNGYSITNTGGWDFFIAKWN